ncbi:LacI family transcriptional regulator [Catellatospora sp. TT07R-123]|uniref:LacI family DNA-binding transcriptional regulator n=1 Tax=Catellatospora sp. TT07R-123 TaxID=2733863 RepID=UPI001B1D1716|nr:LacI family DNA-binding transcriptional regulator [Catellatospora sp. TT07R-123]GHJ47833.1 LacI family transcriptional regulator [Catellatospora sp. TT07R-123]
MTSKRADQRAPTLEQVAEQAGVSRSTVSRVINGVATVDPELRQVVQQAIEATGYVPNLAARSLVTRRTDSVALVVSEADDRDTADPFLNRIFTDPFLGRITAGALEVLRPEGIHLVIMPAEWTAQNHVVRYLRQGHVDGVLLISSHTADPLPRQLCDLNIPAVLSARPGQPLPMSYVDVEQQVGAKLAAEHLLGIGRHRLGTVSGPLDMPSAQDRLNGFRAALAVHGYPYVPSAVGDFTRGSGENATRELLAAHPDIDGLFVANDLMAEGALQALRDLGRRVPEDVAVVGFDDSVAALQCRPQLTTVHQPLEEMAAEMARLLLARISQPEARARSVIFHPRLIRRGSA